MSEDKAIRVLESLGGSAELGQIRHQAKKLYPDMQLWRTIHTPLKSLLKKKKVKCRGILKRGGRRNAPKTFWTLTNVQELVPPIKTAQEMLVQDLDKAAAEYRPPEKPEQEKVILKVTPKEVRKKMDEFEINPDAITTIPAPPPVIESEPDYPDTTWSIKEEKPEVHKYKLTQKEDGQVQAQELEPIHDGTIAHEIRQAIKEPYLDKLAKLPEKIEKIETKYRGRHDIVYDILRFIKLHKEGFGYHAPGVGVTEIMYKTMLSHWQLKKYLLICMKNELIEKTDNGYKITDKGVEYSNTMDSIPINFD